MTRYCLPCEPLCRRFGSQLCSWTWPGSRHNVGTRLWHWDFCILADEWKTIKKCVSDTIDIHCITVVNLTKYFQIVGMVSRFRNALKRIRLTSGARVNAPDSGWAIVSCPVFSAFTFVWLIGFNCFKSNLYLIVCVVGFGTFRLTVPEWVQFLLKPCAFCMQWVGCAGAR